MANLVNIIGAVGRRTALLARTKDDSAFATQPDDEVLIKEFILKGAIEIATFQGNFKDIPAVVLSATNNTITISTTHEIGVDGLKNAYISIVSGKGVAQSRKITGNTVADANGTLTLTVSENWITNPDDTSSGSMTDIPQYAETDAQIQDLLNAVSKAMETALTYFVVGEWFLAIGEGQLGGSYKELYDDERHTHRFSPSDLEGIILKPRSL